MFTLLQSLVPTSKMIAESVTALVSSYGIIYINELEQTLP